MQDFEKRPLSWSAISSFDYDPKQWYERYILNKKFAESAPMLFGKLVGERLEKDPNYLPEVPRAKIYEYELKCKIAGINCIGFIDSYTEHNTLLEYKTGKAWTQSKADGHGQLKMYCLMLYIMYKIKPENIKIYLISMETEARGDFSMCFVKNMKPQIFEVRITLKDILKFGVKIKKTVEDMKIYASTYAQ